jgi:uncharacterized alpha/beta hydrolase family protein
MNKYVKSIRLKIVEILSTTSNSLNRKNKRNPLINNRMENDTRGFLKNSTDLVKRMEPFKEGYLFSTRNNRDGELSLQTYHHFEINIRQNQRKL